MNKFMKKLGAEGPYEFCDVYGIELLDMVPKPVAGVLLLFPISEASEKRRDDEMKRIEENGQVVSDKLYFMKQTVGNACGTIALVHTVANLQDKLTLSGFFEEFVKKTKDMTPDERAKAIEEDDTLEVEHQEIAVDQAASSNAHIEDVDLHFIAFVEVDGHLYELDGRQKHPINHGPTSEATLLEDAVTKIKAEFMDKNPNEIRFNMVALATPMM